MQIEITLKNYRCFSDEAPATILLGKGFTALVGVNNAGKSSLLKFFYEFRDLFSKLTDLPLFLQCANKGPFRIGLAGSVLDQSEVFCNLNNRDLTIDITLSDIPQSSGTIIIAKRVVIIVGRNLSARLDLYDGATNLGPAGTWAADGTLLKNAHTPWMVDVKEIQSACQMLAATLYVGAFRNAISASGTGEYFDIAIGQTFIARWRQWGTGPRKEQNRAVRRLTRDIEHIFSLKDLHINASDDLQTLQFLIDGQSYNLNELGAGMAQFILVLAAAAIRSQSFVLIDEPELHLHPSLQMDFLTTLGAYATEGVLFSTHSIGLARSAGDWIYSVRRHDGKSTVVPYEATANLAEFLGELSFSGYQDLGFKKVLLVEGVTELKLMQQFLRFYRKDHQVVILPMNGASSINGNVEESLLEVKRITSDIAVLIDSERSSADEPLSTSRQAFVDLCSTLGIYCHVLERRASENYLTTAAAKVAFGDNYRGLGPYEERKTVSPMWKKNENWKVARHISLEDLKGTDLGVFLDSL